MIKDIEYNTERSKLIIPEYGRHFQKMIDFAISIEDRKERNKVAKGIIDIMGNLNPHLRDVEDFQHKLWDQLFIMSDFKLDVDSPFSKPSKELLEQQPEPLKYPQNFPKYRYYGNNIKYMIEVAASWEEKEMREALEFIIANHMKKSYLNWNKDTVEDSVVFEHLYELSNGKIDLRNRGEELTDSELLIKNKFLKNGRASNKKSINNKNLNHNKNRKKRH